MLRVANNKVFPMNRIAFLLGILLFGAAACTADGTAGTETATDSDPDTESGCTPPTFEVGETVELLPGLDATLLERGYGRRAIAGDMVEVHYTGWLFDPNAENERGGKFDSSVDRDQPFEFPLGAGRVIQGWDRGVECMLIGENRLLKIAPDLAYGARGYPGAIPPSATLLFEVKLLDARGPDDMADGN